MTIRVFVLLVIGLCVPGVLVGRIVESWTYAEMFDKADLVVIAQVVSTRDTEERTTLLHDVSVIGVTTEFKSSLILKGPNTCTSFLLHHYRYPSEDDRLEVADGPDLVRIGPYNPTFLLFLAKESDGRYAPVTGQTDPASYSVLRVNGAALGNLKDPRPAKH